MNRFNKTYLTIDDIATRFHRAPKTVHDWVGAKKIPHVKLPTGGVLFDPDEIDKWVAQHAVPGEVVKRKKAA